LGGGGGDECFAKWFFGVKVLPFFDKEIGKILENFVSLA
jgi:hypothetical protein